MCTFLPLCITLETGRFSIQKNKTQVRSGGDSCGLVTKFCLILCNPTERRDAKSKGERERYTQLIAEFQRRARRDKNFFLNEQCKEIEQSNRMGKTRDLFWRRKWQHTSVFLPGESQGWQSLVGCHLWGCTESDTTEAT